MKQIEVKKIIDPILTSDGAGVKLKRSIGVEPNYFDPFLMLDEFGSENKDDYIAGFPPHPHRGIETVTYMLEGEFEHEDSTGAKGKMSSGDVQWMTAGRGIIHSEIPEMIEGRLSGFQLWVNLPSHLKMTAPNYQDIPAQDIPRTEFEGGHVRVIAGKYGKNTGPAIPKIKARLLDVVLGDNIPWSITPEIEMQFFVCVYEGSIKVCDSLEQIKIVPAPAIVLFQGVGKIELFAGTGGASLLFCEGEPINEPVARMGPFVMNTETELMQAVEDYNSGRLAT